VIYGITAAKIVSQVAEEAARQEVARQFYLMQQQAEHERNMQDPEYREAYMQEVAKAKAQKEKEEMIAGYIIAVSILVIVVCAFWYYILIGLAILLGFVLVCLTAMHARGHIRPALRAAWHAGCRRLCRPFLWLHYWLSKEWL
jgi:hypothetical protein